MSFESFAYERRTLPATILSGASVSGPISLAGLCLVGVAIPAASGWTAAALTIEVSVDNGASWISPFNAAGSATGTYSSPAAGSGYAVDMDSLLPYNMIRIRSGTTATPVNQGADRALTIIARVSTV